jgi:hypothetical protein
VFDPAVSVDVGIARRIVLPFRKNRGMMAAPDTERATDLCRNVERGTERVDARTYPYQLDVVASDVADVVGSAGGWLFDRARAGWEVTAFVPENCDPRPLHILGVKTLSLDYWITCGGRQPRALAVAAELVAGNSRVRRAVFAAVESGVSQVSVWGSKRSCSLAQRIDDAQHQLSAAAKVFKAQAVAAT